jgi:hypothetical protein
MEGGTFSIVVRCGETKFSASGQPTLGTGGTAARLALRVCFPHVLCDVIGRLVPFIGRLTIADQLVLINACFEDLTFSVIDGTVSNYTRVFANYF